MVPTCPLDTALRKCTTNVNIGQFPCANILETLCTCSFRVRKLFEENECSKKKKKKQPKVIYEWSKLKSSAYLLTHIIQLSLIILYTEVTPFCCYETRHNIVFMRLSFRHNQVQTENLTMNVLMWNHLLFFSFDAINHVLNLLNVNYQMSVRETCFEYRYEWVWEVII